MELNRRPVASLWIGTRLHYVNQLCLKSHLRHGHPVILYCTDVLENAPEGVEIRPASEIMDISAKRVKETSASFWSNVFRYKMIQKTGAIWIDCDAFCHKPFPEDDDWIFSTHGMRGALNCGVVGLPAKSELMDQLLDYYDNLPDYPAWWNKKQRDKMDTLSDDIPHPTRIYMTERTAFGPQAFTHFVKVTGNMDRARPSSALYPVPFQLADVFFDPHGSVEGWMQEDTLSVHLYTNAIKPYWIKNPPLLGSYVERMCRLVGIDADASLQGRACDVAPEPEVAVGTTAVPPTPTVGSGNGAVIEDLENQLKKAGRVARRKAKKAWTEGAFTGLCSQLDKGSTVIFLRPKDNADLAKALDTGADVVVISDEPDTIAGSPTDHSNLTVYPIRPTDDASDQWRKIIEQHLSTQKRTAFLNLHITGAELPAIEAMETSGTLGHANFALVQTDIQGKPAYRKKLRQLREALSAKTGSGHIILD